MLHSRTSATALRHRRVTGLRLVALMLACVPSASAEMVERERFSEPISKDYEQCGIGVHEEGEVIRSIQFRVGKGKLESAFFEHLNYRLATTISNPENGKYVTVHAHTVVQDMQATRAGGTLVEVTILEAGQPRVLRDMSGNVVLRDRGAIRNTVLFDTLGDDTPGGAIVQVLAEEVHGPHPGLSDAEFCAMLQEQLG